MEKYPDEVSVLSEQDMCVGPLHEMRDGRDCGCLWYWAGRELPTTLRVDAAMQKAHSDLGTGLWFKTFPYDEARGITRAIVARVWNRAIAYLGYVVGNPECDKNGKLKPVK